MKLSRNRYFSTLVAEIRMGMVEMFSYNFSFFLDIAIVFGLLAFFFISNSGYQLTQYYKSGVQNQKELILLGYVNWMQANLIISAVSTGIRTDNVRGTLENKFMAIVPYAWLLFGDVLTTILISLVEVLVVLLLTSNTLFMTDIPVYSKILPLGVCNHLIHLSYSGMGVSTANYLSAFGLSLGWLAIGITLFHQSVQHAREKGTLFFY
ncbi:hypothetical protein [uncultured Sphaerochaeta sp.]|uniref:hypothetical protein n=1 Tax=uncultured Sphaerochaeta sp. TaxID=886478 RepID=UPI002A0A40B0|nr:hypothetical protein [uncultured Sphaerochaeta sp.]